MRSLILVWLMMLAVPLAAQTSVQTLAQYETVDIASKDLRPGLNARQSWRQSNVSNYRYQLKARCQCPYRGISQVYVLNRQVVRVEDEAGRVRELNPERMQSLRIEALFTLIDRYAAQQPDSMQIRMNRYLGYPEIIRIDPSYRLADDEVDLSITDFSLLKKR